jgi:hypothetical protein
MNSTVTTLEQVVADLSGVLQTDDLAGLSDAERIEVLRVAGEALRRMEAVVVETVATADPVDFACGFGCRSMNELLQRALLTDSRGAAMLVKAARLVTRETELVTGAPLPARWPALRAALLDGAIGVSGLLAATTAVERAGSRIGTADRLHADVMLADFARGVGSVDSAGANADACDVAPPATPDDLRLFGSEIAVVLDPDGAEPNDRNAIRSRYLTIGRERDGVFPIRGNLLPETCAQLQAIIDAQLNPKVGGPATPGVVFTETPGDDDPSGDDPFNSDPRNVIDDRSPAQKRHDALAAALGIAARHEDMPSLGGAAPTLVVHVDAKDLAAGASGWARIPGIDVPVSAAVAAHTGCTGSIQRVLFDEGRIVGITVTDRVFTVHQRRAIVARDRECLIPGCHVPASWCEIHHVTEHSRGGPTDTDNGVPLCWYHHRSLEYSGWEIRMTGGVPQIRGPVWWDPSGKWRIPRACVDARERERERAAS